MKVFIDADGCPVVDIAAALAAKVGAECIIICDTSHIINREGAKTVTVSKGSDSTDFTLLNMLSEGDVAITQDYALAGMCLVRGARVLNQNGMIYTDENILPLLTAREEARKLRARKVWLKRPKKRTAADDKAFSQALSELLK
ncbi:MAG: DUF188 domain-containing protein [Clostridia bacterium]|nr:DUF188 domain-containing protein [Clostridia bacterium]